jgi:site-specific DNA recombinase
MAERDKFPWLKDEFDRLAIEGVLGDPHGESGGAYLRVSSAGQAEESRSGLPRQLEHIREKAIETNLSISWEHVFFDDHSGFEFEDRPGMQELLAAVKDSPGFAHVVIEYLDRLSRNADWHQGYLIERFQNAGQTLVWWKPYHSRIERAVFGAISQDGMEQAIERMKAGTRRKAESGRVTAKTRAYGYVFVDSQGRGKDDPASEWRKDTRYAIHPEEAVVIRRVFEDLVHNGKSLYEIADDLNQEGIKRHQRARYWYNGTLSQIVRKPLYKGEFYANQSKFEKRWNPLKQKFTLHQVKKPRDEWILVPVPAIVEPELWEAAQEVLKVNRRNATRNANHKWLLTGFLRCANCGYRLTSSMSGRRGRGRGRVLAYYCVSHNQPKSIREQIGCDTPTIRASELEAAVWQAITEVIYNPELVIEGLEQRYSEEGIAEKGKHLDYLEEQMKTKEDELERWNQAYEAGYLDLTEWGEKKLAIQQALEKLTAAVETTRQHLAQRDDLERQKQIVLTELTSLREAGLGTEEDLPFEAKRKIIALLVDDIVIRGKERTFELQGIIRTTRSYGQDFMLDSMARST